MDAIDTERLVLRAYTEADAPRVLAIHSRLDVIQWLGNPPYVPMATLEEAREWIAAKRRNADADPFDDADTLMPGGERQGGLDRPVTVGGVDVGVAQAGGLDPDDDLARTGLGLGHLLDGERCGEVVDDGSLHGVAPSGQGRAQGQGGAQNRPSGRGL